MIIKTPGWADEPGTDHHIEIDRAKELVRQINASIHELESEEARWSNKMDEAHEINMTDFMK